jgi:phage/plasmid primase-like uncharacterized protein
VKRKTLLTTPNVPRVDLTQLTAQFRAALDADHLQRLVFALGLSVDSLNRLAIGWSSDHEAWSFPMTDPGGNVRGIRLRRPNGFKFSVTGSKEGLFLPAGTEADSSPLLVCEGPTDTAALLDMDFANVVGRPSCTGGVKPLVELVKQRRPAEIIVVADADEPGQRGAANLALVLVAYVSKVRIIAPPAGIKDARDWLRAGGTRKAVEEVIAEAPVRRLAVRALAVQKG